MATPRGEGPKHMTQFLDPLDPWPCPPPEGYRGQLDAEFQRRRAAHYSSVTLDACDWYHTTTLPDGEVLHGEWDLRGREDLYLGETPLAQATVLEIGPASGHLTFWMEGRGADVTAFEVGYDAVISMVPPIDRADADAAEAGVMRHTRRTTNAWWFLHRLTGSSARLAHGDLYHLPEDLGAFDLAVLGNVLLHCRDPFKALAQASSHATRTVVVVELLASDLDGDDPLLRFGPHLDDPGPVVTWWQLSPGAIRTMLWRLGFQASRVVRHNQRYHVPGSAKGETVELPLFTVVAERTDPSTVTQVPGWYRDRGKNGGAAGRRLLEVEQELATTRRELKTVRSACDASRDAARKAEAELQRLRATRTFRWTAPLRRLYGELRELRSGR